MSVIRTVLLRLVQLGWLLCFAVFAKGCQIQSTVIQCGDKLCPAATRCYSGVCANPAALAACNNATDGQDCLVDGASGKCASGLCQVQICGNAAIESGEVCDDGNRRDNDECSADCTSTEACGNGIVDDGEGCDCGVNDGARNPRCAGLNSDSLTAECRRDCQSRDCGDGVKNGLEDCDGTDLGGATCPSVGLYGGTLGCTSACRFDIVQCERCGDGIVNGDEACDGQNAGTCANFGGGFGTAGCSLVCTAVVGQCGYTDWAILPNLFASRLFYGIAFGTDALFAGLYGAVRMKGDQPSLIPGVTVPVFGVSGTSITDVIFVGVGGHIFHYDGSSAVEMVSPTTAELKAVYVASSTFAVAGGGERRLSTPNGVGVLLVFDGVTWQIAPLPAGTSRVYSLIGTSARDIWMGTQSGQVLHYDG